MILKIYIFRHGQTDWNNLYKFQGQTNIPLNDEGIRQAEQLAYSFLALPTSQRPQRILSSNLDRAFVTASIVARALGISVTKNPDLIECDLGDVEGLTATEIVDKFGQECITRWSSLDSKDEYFAFPGGETKSEHIKRLKKSIHNFVEEMIEEKVNVFAVSTHGGCLVRFVHSCLEAPTERVKAENCSCFLIEYDTTKKEYYYKQKMFVAGV